MNSHYKYKGFYRPAPPPTVCYECASGRTATRLQGTILDLDPVTRNAPCRVCYGTMREPIPWTDIGK